MLWRPRDSTLGDAFITHAFPWTAAMRCYCPHAASHGSVHDKGLEHPRIALTDMHLKPTVQI